MQDGNTSPKIKMDSDRAQCMGCRRTISANELYGAHGLCSQCLEGEGLNDGMGGE